MVASANNIVDLCINKSKSFIYTSALPSVFVKHSLQRIQDKNRKKYQLKLEKNKDHIISGLKEIGYSITSKTHIIPIIIGDEKTTLDFGEFLYKNKIFAQPIRYPTVPQNQARLRISVTSWLTDSEIEEALGIFEKGYKKFDF